MGCAFADYHGKLANDDPKGFQAFKEEWEAIESVAPPDDPDTRTTEEDAHRRIATLPSADSGGAPWEEVETNGEAERPFAPGTEKFVPPRLGRKAEEEGHLRIGAGRSLWRYESGVYRPDGLGWLEGFVRRALGDEFREGRMREVKAWCKANPGGRLPTQPPTDFINCINGILYWKETPPRLEPHSPDIPSVIQVPVEWRGPEATCPAIFEFLRRVLPEDEDQTLLLVMEWIGYLLVPTAKFKRAVMLEGPGDTGKSTLLNLIEALLGAANVSHATLQSIAEDRFTAADLYGKLANLSADLDAGRADANKWAVLG